jgi:tRNA modification GTPase
LKDGLKVALVGRPNVGKSSVFNILLANDRAIVTEHPGTTRDTLSEVIDVKDVPVLLTDTAGVRSSEDVVESLGVERTRRAIVESDLVIVVLDGSQPLTQEDEQVLLEVEDSLHLIALNKCDLESFSRRYLDALNPEARKAIDISARTGAGLDLLRDAILEPFAAAELHETGLLITDARHFDLLKRAKDELDASRALLEQRASEELVLVGLYNALHLLGEITGETTAEDVLSQIFATFCIGK